MRDDTPWQERWEERLIRAAVTVRSFLSRLLRPGSLVVLVVVALAGAGALLRELSVPNVDVWKPGEPLAIGLAVAGGLAALGYLLVIVGYRRMLKQSTQNPRLYAACRDVAALIARTTTLDHDDIAVHVWSVRGLPGLRRLERRATFVPRDRPPSAITWRKGKGVLGQVWVRDQWILADLEPLANAASEEEFYSIPRDERFFFSWQEAQAAAQYKAILAWPLHGGPENARRVIGCLSVDAQAPGGVAQLGSAWDSQRPVLWAHVGVCEGVLGGE
jgi:hypothetical protein